MKLKVLTCCILMAASANAAAEGKAKKPQKVWDVTSEVGAIITSGNTRRQRLKAGSKLNTI